MSSERLTSRRGGRGMASGGAERTKFTSDGAASEGAPATNAAETTDETSCPDALGASAGGCANAIVSRRQQSTPATVAGSPGAGGGRRLVGAAGVGRDSAGQLAAKQARAATRDAEQHERQQHRQRESASDGRQPHQLFQDAGQAMTCQGDASGYKDTR